MPKIKVNRNSLAAKRRKQGLGEINDPAAMRYENFETIMGFKPSLELLEGKNHEAPDMSKNNAPRGIENPKDDPNQPTAQEIANGLTQEKAPDTKAEKPPHENENVNQRTPNSDSAPPKVAHEVNEDLTANDYQQQIPSESGGRLENEPEVQVDNTYQDENEVQRAQDEYAEKFMIGAQLADIKISANLLKDVERYSFINKMASSHSVDTLKNLLEENQALYESMKTRVEASQQKTANRDVFIPRTYPQGTAPTSGMDGLSAILGG